MDLIALSIFFCGFVAAGAIEEKATGHVTLFSVMCWASAIGTFVLALSRLDG